MTRGPTRRRSGPGTPHRQVECLVQISRHGRAAIPPRAEAPGLPRRDLVMSAPVTLALTGDVMLGRKVNEALRHFGPTHPWGDLLPVLSEADLTVVNLECVIARAGRPWSRWPKVFHFRADPVAI